MVVSSGEENNRVDLSPYNASVFETVLGQGNVDEPVEVPDDALAYVYIILSVFYAIVFLVGIGGDILVAVVVARNRDMRTSTNWYLVNLSVADLMVLAVCMPVALLEFHSRDV